MRNVPALSEGHLSTLVELGQNIEAHYGSPQDIEWACCQDQFYVLQSRPITTLERTAPVNTDGMEYNRTMFIEILPDPVSPVFLSGLVSLFGSMLDFTFEAMGFKPPEDMMPAIGFFNQPYFNRCYIEAALEPLPEKIRKPLVDKITNPFGEHDRGSSFSTSPAFVNMLIRIIRFMTSFPKQLPILIEQYRKDIDEVNSVPLKEVSDVQIMQHINELLFGIASKLLNYDFLMITVIGRAYGLLNNILARNFGEQADEICAKLITGLTGNVTMETNKALWDLAQKAKVSPLVRNLLSKYKESEFQTILGLFPEGQSFQGELNRFLGEYGHREVRLDILYPTWIEDPTPVLSFVQAYLDSDETQSPHLQQERLVKERQALTDKVLTTMGEDLIGRLVISPLFRWLLKHTQIHARERDTMHFELTRLFPPFRRLLLELGRRRANQGYFSHQEDVFFLALNELTEFAEKPEYVMDKVRERKEEFELNKSRPWPDIIRDGQEIYLDPPASIETPDGSMKGIAGSPGQVTGSARVILGPQEFEQLQKGEILIAPLTNPVWTPLFAVACGVVTEVGGILSHGAIVAREYGIPAVMSIPNATNKIKDGQTITVDGNRGIVKVEE
jgi:pyruvate,water dikinase